MNGKAWSQKTFKKASQGTFNYHVNHILKYANIHDDILLYLLNPNMIFTGNTIWYYKLLFS